MVVPPAHAGGSDLYFPLSIFRSQLRFGRGRRTRRVGRLGGFCRSLLGRRGRRPRLRAIRCRKARAIRAFSLCFVSTSVPPDAFRALYPAAAASSPALFVPVCGAFRRGRLATIRPRFRNDRDLVRSLSSVSSGQTNVAYVDECVKYATTISPSSSSGTTAQIT